MMQNCPGLDLYPVPSQRGRCWTRVSPPDSGCLGCGSGTATGCGGCSAHIWLHTGHSGCEWRPHAAASSPPPPPPDIGLRHHFGDEETEAPRSKVTGQAPSVSQRWSLSASPLGGRRALESGGYSAHSSAPHTRTHTHAPWDFGHVITFQASIFHHQVMARCPALTPGEGLVSQRPLPTTLPIYPP